MYVVIVCAVMESSDDDICGDSFMGYFVVVMVFRV